jgi:hypothetical protein
MPPKTADPKKGKKKVTKAKGAQGRTKAKGGIAQNIQAHRSMLRAITKSTIVKNNVALHNAAAGGAGGSSYLTYGQPNQQAAAKPQQQPMTFNINLNRDDEPKPAKQRKQADRMEVDAPPKPAMVSKGTQSKPAMVSKGAQSVFIKPERSSTGTQSVFIKPERASTGTQMDALDPDAADISDARPPKRLTDPPGSRRAVKVVKPPEPPFTFGRVGPYTSDSHRATQEWHKDRRAYRFELNRDLASRSKERKDSGV